MFVDTKMLIKLKKQISTSIWSAQHPSAGQNIQQKLEKHQFQTFVVSQVGSYWIINLIFLLVITDALDRDSPSSLFSILAEGYIGKVLVKDQVLMLVNLNPGVSARTHLKVNLPLFSVPCS